MKNKRFFRKIIVIMAALVLMCGFSVTAYAGGGENIPPEETPPAETAKSESTPNPVALTPDGNLTLVDDIEGEQAEDKQFITVVTKNGNYFYIIIDRAGDSDNVYFLNMVDEADLMAILEELDDTPAQPVITPQPDPEPETPPAEPEPEKEKSNVGSILILILLIAGAGGGAFYYFKVLKPKQGAQGGDLTELDELEFDDGDDFLSEDADEPVDDSDEE